MKPSENKIKSIKDAARPEDQKAVRSFLGLTNYLKRFIQDYSTKTFPLRQLLKYDSQFSWTTECEKSFQTLKTELSSNCCLTLLGLGVGGGGGQFCPRHFQLCITFFLPGRCIPNFMTFPNFSLAIRCRNVFFEKTSNLLGASHLFPGGKSEFFTFTMLKLYDLCK